MANTYWTTRLYSIGGSPISGANMNVLAPATSNKIEHATNRTLQFPLNGIDSLSFSVYLDDPMAVNIMRLRTVVKVWRTVLNDGGGLVYQDGGASPCFAGVVTYTLKNGDENIMNVNCMSPLWRLQSRFHLLNHYLKTNIETADPYTQSQLMWKLIDLVNNAFGLEDSNTGIAKGTFASGADPEMAPYFVPKGSNTWTNIFEEIMNRPGGVDIIPRYYHSDGDPTMMYFDTDEKRTGPSAGFRYHTGSSDNLANLEEETQVVPGEFANYLWAVGAGGPNSGKIAMEENVDGDDGYSNIGIYMRRADFPDIKKIGLAGPPATDLKAVAGSEFAQAQFPKPTYNCEISPAGGIYYGSNFTVGSMCSVTGSKGALQVSASGQRIYDASITISDNNVEQSTVAISEDFTEYMPEG